MQLSKHTSLRRFIVIFVARGCELGMRVEKLVADIPNHLKETKNGPLKARGRDASSFRDIESVLDVKAVSANDDNHKKSQGCVCFLMLLL
jgi:hypothetical protein